MYTETSSCTPANGCPQNQGSLPGGCGTLAFPFVAMQQQDPPRYDQREALQQGTLFPGLDLPFHKELRSRFPAANNALSELMALDFAIDELGLYLVTHADDQEVLNLYWKYIALAKEGRARYQEQYGPLTQTTVTEGGYRWLKRSVALGRRRFGLMFVYEKKLQYPVRIANPNPKLAAFIISQYGGPDGELGASLRYLSQRYSMPYPELKALLTDIGREASEMFHSEATAFFDAFATV